MKQALIEPWTKQSKDLINDLWEKGFWKHFEKTSKVWCSIFSFSHNAFRPIKDRNFQFSNISVVVCNFFEFGTELNSN